MGRTLLPFRIAFDVELIRWKQFRDSLDLIDQNIFDKIISFARFHSDAGSMAVRPMFSEFIFVSALIEQQKMIDRLQQAIINYERRYADGIKREF